MICFKTVVIIIINEAIYKTDLFIAWSWLEPRVSIKEKEYLCAKHNYCFLLPDQSGTDSSR